MGSEPVEELPEDLEAWVAERAADSDASRAEVARRLLAAHKLLDDHPEWPDDAAVSGRADGVVEPADGPDGLDARVDELAGRIGELEADLDEKISDVRQRVIQVKREADAKAPPDHDHPSIEHRIDEGFGNYEEVLEYLTERAETLEAEADDREEKLRTVANAVVDLRRRVSAIESELQDRAAIADLREAANRRGVSEAACGGCGESVQLALLDEPACPHCESPFDGVEAGGWFEPNTLTVGDRPALESSPAAPDAGGSSERTGSAPMGGAGGSNPSATAVDEESAGTGGEGPAAGLSDLVGDTPDGSYADPDTEGVAGGPAEGDGDENAVSDDPLAPGGHSDDRSEADRDGEDED